MEFKLFYEITSVLIVAGAIAALISMLKQPSILAFILTGLIVGPFGYYQLQQTGALDTLGQIGITLLLFMVGLELDFQRVRQLGKVALYAGLGQVALTSGFGYLLARALGFNYLPALYLAVALTFSSTIIIVKLLTEKKDLQSLYARIAVGVFLVQDFVALGILLFLGGRGSQSSIFLSLPAWQFWVISLVKALIITLLLLWLSKRVFPKFLNRFGQSDELLLIFSLAWALGLAAFMSLPVIGLSLEIGGFIAGLALANSQVHYEIGAKIRSLRDFFIIIFFIVFGTRLVFSGIGNVLLPAIVLSAFVLIAKPLILMVLIALMGYKPKTAFFSSVTVAQISEFSFVLVAIGNRLGYVSDQILALVTLVGIVTIAVSSYMILYSDKLYQWLRAPLSYLDFKHSNIENSFRQENWKNHIILVGSHRLGSHLVDSLKKLKNPLVIVDLNPELAESYSEKNYSVICGDITDPYIQDLVNLESAKLIISTIPNFGDNLALLEAVNKRTLGKRTRPKLIFAAQDEAEARHLYEKEIDYVISPHFIGAMHLAHILEDDHQFKSLKKLKERHLKVIGNAV